MEQKTRVAVGSAASRVMIEMGQTMRVLDAREGLALCEVPDAYLLRECEVRGLIDGESLDELLLKTYLKAKEECNGQLVSRFVRNRMIQIAYAVEGGKGRVSDVLGASTKTVRRALAAHNGGDHGSTEDV